MPRIPKIPASDEDRAAVVAHVEKYAHALSSPSHIATLKASFHSQSTIFANWSGTIKGGPIQWLYDVMEQGGEMLNLDVEVSLLSITPTTAVAQVDLMSETDGQTRQITDFLSLIKMPEGGWTIVSKIYEAYQYN